MMEKLYLALGSNLGDRERNITRALELLGIRFNGHALAISPMMETKAIGFDGKDFINCVALYDCGSDPFEVLDICKSIERQMGRTDEREYDAEGRRVYHDRIIDIDILIYGKVRIDTPQLKIPHPQVESREYIKNLLLNLRD